MTNPPAEKKKDQVNELMGFFAELLSKGVDSASLRDACLLTAATIYQQQGTSPQYAAARLHLLINGIDRGMKARIN